MTKPIESYDQLIERFTKRTAQLSARAAEVKEAHDEYLRIQKDLARLEAVSYTHLTLPTNLCV